MSWNKISAIAEIVSSVAILVTLIYLMMELQQNTVALQTSARQATVQGDVDFLYRYVDDPGLLLNAFKNELTDEEAVQLSAQLFAFMRMREHDWLQHQANALDDVTLTSYQKGLISTLSTPQSRKWWEYFQGGVFAPGFEGYVNGLLENEPVRTVNSDIQAFR